MAKILALDTSTDACSVALDIDGERIETFKIIPRKHTHELLPIIKQTLADAQLHINQLDAIAFGRGPGSFAGIRIATGVAQGLAFAADLAAIPISTLGCLAQGYYRNSSNDKSLIVSAIDARMDEIYWGGYTIEQGVAQLKITEVVSPPSDLLLANSKISNLVAIGSGYQYIDKMSEELVSAFTHIDNSAYPHALDMLALAGREWELGNTLAAEDAQPVYLRNQVAWKKKDQQ